ncbi:TPA: hypothetical protein ACGO1T_001596 [Streptococcus suis]
MTEVFQQAITEQAIEFPQECYYCGEIIEKAEDATYLPINLETVKKIDGKKKRVKQLMLRVLHHECSGKINKLSIEKKQEEMDYRRKIFVLFGKWLGKPLEDENGNPIKGLKGKDKTSPYLVTRIDGLRQGRTFSKGQNVHKIGRGNSFKEIYVTMVMYTGLIENRLFQLNFESERNKISYIMSILEDRIPSVKKLLQRQQVNDAKLDKAIEEYNRVEMVSDEEYVAPESIKLKEMSETQREFIEMFREEDDDSEPDIFDLFV